MKHEYHKGMKALASYLSVIYYTNSELKEAVVEANSQSSAPYEYVGFSGEPESIRCIVSPK
jgi:hypothetical protein